MKLTHVLPLFTVNHLPNANALLPYSAKFMLNSGNNALRL
jgi:hypothetical protein